MSAAEIVASLAIEVDADLVVELEEQLAAAEEIASLDFIPSPSKLALVAHGGTLYAKFIPGPSGSGPCPKKGVSASTGSGKVDDLAGDYMLVVGRVTMKLYDQAGKEVWSGMGGQKGLIGRWPLKF